MDVAITGSSGLIGSRLATSLAADGHVVRRVTRGAPGPGRVTWSPEEGRLDTTGLAGVDAVVHLAGEGIAGRRWTDEQKARLRESRTRGTALLASVLATLEPRPRVLLSGSAMGYYGDRGDEVLTESAPPATGFLARLCVDWEAAAAPAAAAGIRVAHLRTSLVLDAHGGALAKMLPLFKLGLGGRLGSGRQWWSWVTLDDHVAATRFLLEHDVAGPVNLASPGAVTNADFARALGRAVHRPAVLPVPRFAPRLVLGGELAEELLFTSARLRPAALEQAGFTFAHPGLDEALRHVLGA